MHCILSIIVLMSHTGSKEMEYEIGCQGILRKHEDPTVKLYASEILTAKMCNTEHGMMGESGGQSVYRGTPEAEPASPGVRCQFVYRGTLGVVWRTQNNRSAILSPPAREPAIEKVAKYGMRKSSVRLVI
jgi:hypothetical protein